MGWGGGVNVGGGGLLVGREMGHCELTMGGWEFFEARRMEVRVLDGLGSGVGKSPLMVTRAWVGWHEGGGV